MDPQLKQKFFLFTGAIILVIIAILATPFDAPSFPISILPSEQSSTVNLVQDEAFSFTQNTWNISPAVKPLVSSGATMFQTSGTPLTLTQNIPLDTSVSGIRIYFDGTSENSAPITLELSDEKGNVQHTSYTANTDILTEDVVLSNPLSSLTLKIILPKDTVSFLRDIRITPIFSATKA